MKRLSFALALGLLVAPLPAAAQQAGKVPRIGFLSPSPGPPGATYEAFRQGLRHLGWIEGQNIIIEYRWAQKPDRLPDLARELARLNVDVFVTASTPGIQAARQASSVIPIVFTAVGDPVAAGFVASLRRPGANITGLTILAPELSRKRLELISQAFPRVSRVGVVWNPTNPSHALLLKETEVAAQALGLALVPVKVQGSDDFGSVFSSITAERVGAVVVLPDPVFTSLRRRFADFTARSRLPAIYDKREYVDEGGLMAYGPSFPDLFRRAATYVDKILKGAKPADLPVEQPTKFELVINLKTAKALGLTIPQSLLIRADQLIN